MQWTTVAVPFLGGADTKSDRLSLQPPKLLRAENATFDKRGSLACRHGYTRFGRDVSDETMITNGSALFTRGDELVMLDGERLYSRNVHGEWEAKGNLTPLAISTATVADQASNQHSADYAEADGAGVYAWEDSRGGVRYSVVDLETGQYRVNDTSLATDGYAPRCIAINGFIHILYVDDSEGALRTKIIKPQNLAASVAEASVELVTDIRDTSPIAYDVVPYGNGARFAYAASNGTDTKIYKLSKSGSATGGVTLTKAATSIALGVTSTDQIQRLLLVCGTATGVSVSYADVDALSFSAFEDATIADVVRVAVSNCAVPVALEEGGDAESNESTFTIWVERSAASSSNHLVELYAFSSFNTFAGTLFHTIRHAGLASGGFRQGRYGYAVLTHVSDVQPTYFLYRHDAVLVGRFLAGVAGGFPQSSRGARVLPAPKATSAGPWVFAGVRRDRLETTPSVNANGVVTGQNVSRSDYALARCALDFSAPVRGVEVGGSLYLSGGMLWQYDGQSVVESGFALFSEGVTAVVSNGSGSLNGTGDEATYGYVAYPEWYNAQGERERGTGLPIVVTLTASDDTVTLTLPTLSHTLKLSPRSDVSWVVYRTEANPVFDSVLYRVSNADPSDTSGANRFVANDPTANTVSFEDNLSDTDLITKERDYQAGGALEHIAPPAPAVLTQGHDRVFVVPDGDRSAVYYSKLRVTGEAVSFNDSLVVPIDYTGGEVTAVGVVNETLVAFKRGRIYSVTGTGQSNTGVGDYEAAQLVTSDCGCVDQRSLVETPEGLMFMSAKGWRLLNQSLQVVDVGADMFEYRAQNVTAATLVADLNQVRLLTDDGMTLMYDYYFKQWSTWSNHEGVDACVWNGVYCYLRSDGRVMAESEGYDDGGAEIRRVVETAEIRLGAVQGYQRIRRAIFIGEYQSNHRLRVHVFFDGEPGAAYSFEWDPQAVLNLEGYGEGDYGDGAYGGTGSTVYQARHRMRRQKCQTVRFRIEPVPGTPAGASFLLTEMALEVGLKGGVNRVSRGKDT